MTTNVIVPSHSYNFRSILEREKLNGTNFLYWFRNLRIVLTHDKKLYVLDGPIPDTHAPNASKAIKDAWAKHVDDSSDVSCLIWKQVSKETWSSIRLTR